MKYFLHIGYDGGNYRGWQFQPDAISVQEVLEENLSRIFKQKITINGCGRTDAGVHASQYFMHIELFEELNFDLKFRLNKNLPDDIAVFDVLEMEENNHCRFDAISRTYDYYIHLQKDPILNKYSSFYELENLDFEAMQKATSILAKQEDFKAVCKQPQLYKHTICNVTAAKLIVSKSQQRLRFTITANRFLRGMVRICVFYLLKIGKGEISLQQFEKILANQIEVPEIQPAFPNGLFLSKVTYPYLNMPVKEGIGSFLQVGLDG